jgi:hypothetical protein
MVARPSGEPRLNGTAFADCIVFADESGDHGLDHISDGFPLFALVFCVLHKEDYAGLIVPALQRLKFEFWGHDHVVLHERDIRRQDPPFGFLRTDAALRARFLEAVNQLIVRAPMRLFAAVIDKRRLCEKYQTPWNPYELALRLCMERLVACLIKDNQAGRLVHVIFESRGRREDAELELEFRRVAANQANWGYRKPDFTRCVFEPVFASKAANCAGLQLADLTARPLALSVLRPDQPNRAMDLIRPKVVELKCFP